MRRTLLAFILFIWAGGLHAEAAENGNYLIFSTSQHIEELKERYPEAVAFDLLPVLELQLTEAGKEALQAEFPEAAIHPVLTYNAAVDKVPVQFTQISAQPANTSPYTGKGVKVAVIDTGIDVDHPELKVAGGICTLPTGCTVSKPYDDNDQINGHGTHVAGVLAAQKNEAGIIGIAPGIELYAVKALNSRGGGSSTSVMAGVEWAIKNDMDIINLSISITEDDPLLKLMLQKAYDSGILTVGAAGNLAGSNSVTYPARYSTVIAVAGVDRNNSRLSMSSAGTEVEFTAPGAGIMSTTPIELDMDGQPDGYRVLSGTSMATPHVTGLLALYKERFPAKSSEELRDLLAATAHDLGAEGRDTEYGYGLATYQNTISNAPFVTNQAIDGQITVALKNKENASRWSLEIDGVKVTETAPGQWELYRLAGTYKAIVRYTDKTGTAATKSFTINMPTPAFGDMPGTRWYADEVAYLSHNGWIYGYQDTTFQPDRQITRAEAVALLGRARGLNGGKRKTVFKDVSEQSFASGYIQSAVEEGILSGFPDGTFRPGQPVTRAEMAILISKTYGLAYDETIANPFSDVSPSMASHTAIQKMVQSDVTDGYADGTFRPTAHMTRSTFSVFLAKADRPDLF